MSFWEWLVLIKVVGGLAFAALEYGLVVGRVSGDHAETPTDKLRKEAGWRALIMFILWPFIWP